MAVPSGRQPLYTSHPGPSPFLGPDQSVLQPLVVPTPTLTHHRARPKPRATAGRQPREGSTWAGAGPRASRTQLLPCPLLPSTLQFLTLSLHLSLHMSPPPVPSPRLMISVTRFQVSRWVPDPGCQWLSCLGPTARAQTSLLN
jgi:hypothetical protein